MNISIKPGAYVVAVSGGVDSMVLMDLLRQQPDVRLIVAHYDHGIRGDSEIDRKLAQRTAKRHGLQFVFDEGRLGPGTSEAEARKARYEFLNKVKDMSNARAIITAHHQDDVIETAILNLIRGTGRRGLSSLRSTDELMRPLLHVPKQHLRDYAKANDIVWREDRTNQDTKYLRNYIRRWIMPKFTDAEREKFVRLLLEARELNDHIDARIVNHLHLQPAQDQLDRHQFIMLTHKEACEVMAAWLRQYGIRKFDKKLLEQLVVRAKTLHNGQRTDVTKNVFLKVNKGKLALIRQDR